MGSSGICMDSYVRIEDDCSIDYEIDLDQVELRFGPHGAFSEACMVTQFDERGLTRMLTVVSEALAELRRSRPCTCPVAPTAGTGTSDEDPD